MKHILSCTLSLRLFCLCSCIINSEARLTGLNDLQEVLDPMQPSGMQLPVFMGGQSMGGMLTILTALRDQSAWQVHDCLPARLTLNGPILDIDRARV